MRFSGTADFLKQENALVTCRQSRRAYEDVTCSRLPNGAKAHRFGGQRKPESYALWLVNILER